MSHDEYSRWSEHNLEAFNKAMDSLKFVRSFVDAYSHIVILAPDSMDGDVSAIAGRLVTEKSKRVFWSSCTGAASRFREKYQEDCLESLVHDQADTKSLVVFLSFKQKDKEMERALQYCAENFIPCMVIAASPEGTPGALSGFSFPSKVFDLLFKTEDHAAFWWLVNFIFMQASVNGPSNFRLDK